jgi:branched-chain amino acid transport system substrate-binding protein
VTEFIEFPENGGDLSGLTQRVATLDPDAAYLAGYADDISAMIRGLRSEGYDGHILTTAAFSAPAVIEQVGRAAENVLLTQTDFDPDAEDGPARQFVEAYRAAYGLTPDLYAAHGYDALRVLVAAIDGNAGGPNEVWSGLRALREFQGVTGPLQFDERGDVQKFPRVYRVSDGRLVDHLKDLRIKQDEIRRRREELQRRIADAQRASEN